MSKDEIRNLFRCLVEEAPWMPDAVNDGPQYQLSWRFALPRAQCAAQFFGRRPEIVDNLCRGAFERMSLSIEMFDAAHNLDAADSDYLQGDLGHRTLLSINPYE